MINSKKEIPFYPQIWDLKNWHNLGFKSLEEAKYWQDSSCGILCLKMATEGILGREIDSVSTLISKGQSLGAYSDKDGWSHRGLAELAHSYGIQASLHERISTDDLIQFIDQGAIPIVSIKWAFQPSKNLKDKLMFWKKRGGHLALVVGYKKGRGFFVHHTSITDGYNWNHKIVSFDEFEIGFTGRGIITTKGG